MGRGRGAGGWQPSPVTVVVVGAAFALVGNLATNTVQVSGRWWPPVVWTVAGLLLAVSVAAEWRGHRLERAAAGGGFPLSVPALRVFGAIPRPAQHFQPRPVQIDELRRVLKGRGRAALVALPGARGAGASRSWRRRTRGRVCGTAMTWWRG